MTLSFKEKGKHTISISQSGYQSNWEIYIREDSIDKLRDFLNRRHERSQRKELPVELSEALSELSVEASQD